MGAAICGGAQFCASAAVAQEAAKVQIARAIRDFIIRAMPKNSADATNILFEISSPGEASGQIATRLAEEVAAQFGPRDESPFTLTARDAAGEVIGGINGVIHWRWAYIRQFHIDLAERGQGLGRALLKQVEQYARQMDCVGVYLDTFDRGALEFYQSCGFAVAGAIENFPPGAARTFLSKALT